MPARAVLRGCFGERQSRDRGRRQAAGVRRGGSATNGAARSQAVVLGVEQQRARAAAARVEPSSTGLIVLASAGSKRTGSSRGERKIGQ
jgi:hypothetical protein